MGGEAGVIQQCLQRDRSLLADREDALVERGGKGRDGVCLPSDLVDVLRCVITVADAIIGSRPAAVYRGKEG